MNSPLVSILCITYNHEPYIKEAIDSFLSQKTSFEFEIVIGEDKSRDGTLEICKEYKEKNHDIITLITSEKNVGMVENFQRVAEACRGKYIAICEGDDYWDNPHKLQMQVDFLMNHPEYKMVHGKKKVLYNNEFIKDKDFKFTSGHIFEDIVISNFIQTLTVMAERECLLESVNKVASLALKKQWKMLDYPLWLDFAMHHQIGFLDEYLAVYRVLPESASRSKSKKKNYLFEKSVLEVKEHFYKIYKKEKRVSKQFRFRFKEMALHARKRLVLNNGLIAKSEFGRLILALPFVVLLVIKKMERR